MAVPRVWVNDSCHTVMLIVVGWNQNPQICINPIKSQDKNIVNYQDWNITIYFNFHTQKLIYYL